LIAAFPPGRRRAQALLEASPRRAIGKDRTTTRQTLKNQHRRPFYTRLLVDRRLGLERAEPACEYEVRGGAVGGAGGWLPRNRGFCGQSRRKRTSRGPLKDRKSVV